MSETKTVLLVGNGGREHAIAEAIDRSATAVKLCNYGGSINPGIEAIAADIRVGNVMDFDAIVAYAQKVRPAWCVIGPDNPIGGGLADKLEAIGIPCFAPTKANAQLEASKAFTRDLLKEYGVEGSPGYAVFTPENAGEMRAFYDTYNGEIVVKADGLLGGKGVIVAGDHFGTFEEAEAFGMKSIEKFGRVVLEEKIMGVEFSLISMTDGETVLDTLPVQDHKRAYEGDKGPNTGGMGTISGPSGMLEYLTEEDVEAAHTITVETVKALQDKTGEKYCGVLFGGFMKTPAGEIKLIEYNCRFGDPEALNIFSLMESDFVRIVEYALEGKLGEHGPIRFAPHASVVRYLCPEGYPEKPVRGVSVKAPRKADLDANQRLYYASVGVEGGKLILGGSRALGCVGLGENYEVARTACQGVIAECQGPLFSRADIGSKELRAMYRGKLEG